MIAGGKSFFGAAYFGPSYFGGEGVVVPPLTGTPTFTRTVRAITRRIGATPDHDGADRVGETIVATARRIGRTLQ